MKSKIHKTELRLPHKLAMEIKKMAKKKGLSFNQYMRFAVQEKLETDLCFPIFELKAQAKETL